MNNCQNLFNEDCLIWNDNRKLITVSENGRTFKGDNKQQYEFSLFRVDDCIISDKTVGKCDYLLLNCSEQVAYFIELKGSDLIKAITQIDSSITLLLKTIEDFKIINARVVLTKVKTPSTNSSYEIKLKKKLKNLGGTLEYKSILFEENLKIEE
jgi:hypothetical protein